MSTPPTAKRQRVMEPPADPDGPPLPPVAEPMARRPEPSASTQATGIQALPVSLLLDQIFSWIAPPAKIPDDLITRGLDPRVFNWKLFTVQQVCRAWHWHAKALAANYRAHTWRLDEADVVYHLTKPVAPRAPSNHVTQLRIKLSCPHGWPTMGVGRSASFHSKRQFDDLDQFLPLTYWTDVFTSCPALVRLDLSRVPYIGDLLAAILDASSACCPRIQSLVLPITTSGSNWMEDTNVLTLLARVLPTWNEANGGLVHLALPWYRFDPSAQRQLLEIVATYCPKIRYLRDWTNHPEFNNDDPRDYDGGYFLRGGLSEWRFACASVLTNVQEMYWLIPSDCTPFVRSFAETIKPQLKDMYLDYTWRPQQPFNFPALDAATVASFFKATPNLERFSIVTERYYELQLDLATPHDLIVTKLREHCPKLKVLRISVEVYRDNRVKIPMVTDVGVSEILRMATTLRQVSLQPIRISSEQIVVVVDACMKRELVDIEIALFPVENELELAKTVLQHLVDMDTSVCVSRPRFVLRISQPSTNEFPDETRTQLRSLAERLNAKWELCGHSVQTKTEEYKRFKLELRWNFAADHSPPERCWRKTVREQFPRWQELRRHFELFKEEHQQQEQTTEAA